MAKQARAATIKSHARRDAAVEGDASAATSRILAVARCFTIVALSLLIGALASSQAGARGPRRDDIVFGPSGHPIAGATITVCEATAAGTQCSPLATLYTDATLTTTAPRPFLADGIGNPRTLRSLATTGSAAGAT